MHLASKLSEFLGSLWTQVCASLSVGLPTDDSADRPSEAAGQDPTARNRMHVVAIKSPGRMTRNGLGSLEIGAARDRVDE